MPEMREETDGPRTRRGGTGTCQALLTTRRRLRMRQKRPVHVEIPRERVTRPSNPRNGLVYVGVQNRARRNHKRWETLRTWAPERSNRREHISKQAKIAKLTHWRRGEANDLTDASTVRTDVHCVEYTEKREKKRQNASNKVEVAKLTSSETPKHPRQPRHVSLDDKQSGDGSEDVDVDPSSAADYRVSICVI